MIIGEVWRVPSREAGRAITLEIRHSQRELKPGSLIKDATLFPASDSDGQYVILVGIGEMFDATFLARCGVCALDHAGSILLESRRKRELVKWAYNEWMKLLKEMRRKDKLLLNSLKRSGL
jgi:hypothetical protein